MTRWEIILGFCSGVTMTFWIRSGSAIFGVLLGVFLILSFLYIARPWKWKIQNRRQCFHHDKGGNPANSVAATSWIAEELYDLGRGKRFWCTHCGKEWYI